MPLMEFCDTLYIGITPIIGSYAQCAAILDRIGTVPGTKGIMLIFPEYLAGLQEFGERVLPLMRTAKLASPRPPRAQAETLPLGGGHCSEVAKCMIPQPPCTGRKTETVAELPGLASPCTMQ